MIEIQRAKFHRIKALGRTDSCVKIKPDGVKKELPVVILAPRPKIPGVSETPKCQVEIIVTQANKASASATVSFEDLHKAFGALKELRFNCPP